MGKPSRNSLSSDLESYHDRDSEGRDGLLSQADHHKDCAGKRARESRLSVLIPWVLCIILSIALGASTLKLWSLKCSSFVRPYELKAATRDLPKKHHDVQFDATLSYNSSHLLYRPVTDPPYVGDPSPEIDAAWENLMGSVDVFITPDEQKELGQDLWQDPETGLYVGLLSVMHDLHCINTIRMSLYPDYYPKMYHYTTKIHIEHCLDVLRLSVMCQGDMTLIPTKDSDSRPFEAVFETVHACREVKANIRTTTASGRVDLVRAHAPLQRNGIMLGPDWNETQLDDGRPKPTEVDPGYLRCASYNAWLHNMPE